MKKTVLESYYPSYMEPPQPTYLVEYWDVDWNKWMEESTTSDLNVARYSAMRLARQSELKSRIVEMKND